MDVLALIDEFRDQIEDTDRDDPLWSDENIFFYMNSAQREFARLTDTFVSTYPSDPTITQAAITADDPWVLISPRIIDLRRVTLNSTGSKLGIKRVGDIDGGYLLSEDYGLQNLVKWEDESGTPTTVIMDMGTDQIRLVPISSIADSLNMTVIRFPLTDIENADSTLEVSDTDDQISLINWMKHKAYLKHDADTYDKDLSDEFGAKFLSEMAQRKQRVIRLRRPVRNIRYGGIPFS